MKAVKRIFGGNIKTMFITKQDVKNKSKILVDFKII